MWEEFYMWKLPWVTICTGSQTNLIIQVNTKSEQITLPQTVCGSTTAFVCVLTSSGTPELCVSLFPSVIVMITDGSRKNGLRPWERGNSNIQQLNPSSGKQWAWLFSLCFLFFMLYIKNIVLGVLCVSKGFPSAKTQDITGLLCWQQ